MFSSNILLTFVVVWEKLAEVCGNNLTKGCRVLVEGRLSICSYEPKAAKKRRAAEVAVVGVEFLDRPKESGQGAGDRWPCLGRM